MPRFDLGRLRGEPVLEIESREHGAARMVFMGHRDAKEGEASVPEELLDRAAVAAELAPSQLEESLL